MVKTLAYVVIFPCADARFGEIELAIAGIFLTREQAEERLAECREELAIMVLDNDADEDLDKPYIVEREIG